MFYTVLVAYILGGLTFIPLVVLGGLAFAFFTAEPIDPPTVKPSVYHVDIAEEKSSSTPSSTSTKPRSPTLKTWLTVRRTFEASPSSYISLVRTLLDARSSHPRRAEDAYYAVLKGAILYLYEDEAMSECAAAIDVARCHVRVFPEQGLLDGELFAKRNALLIREVTSDVEEKDRTIIGSDAGEHQVHAPTPSAPWFIFFRSVTLMEDWYLALLAAPHLSSPSPSSTASSTSSTFVPYPYAAHQALITSLDALPDLIPTRWLNALLGRLFLGVKGTRAVEEWVIGRLMKKLAKVKTPGFLSAVVVRSFDAGNVAPVLSKPMLKELTPEGETSVGVDVSYVAPPGGEIRITVSATATISIPGTSSFSLLGFNSGRGKEKGREQDGEKEKEKQGEEGPTKTKDKGDVKEKESQRPYEVSLVLAIVVHRVEGNVLFKIKRPPSNRLWYAFTTAPHMEISVEPVVSDRRVRWGMVLAAIEGKLKEIIQESVVLPYMDDIPFFDTTSYALRGGIFADAFTEAGREAAAATTSTVLNATAKTTTTTVGGSETISTSTTPATPVTEQDPRIPHDMTYARNTVASTPSKPIHHTLSAEALVTPETNAANSVEQGTTRADANGNLGGARKRRTWFGKMDGSGDDGGTENGLEQRAWNQDRQEQDESMKLFVTQDEESQDGTRRSSKEHSSRAMSISDGSPSTEAATRQGLSTSAPSPMSSSSHFPPVSSSSSSSHHHYSPTPPHLEQGSAASAPGSPLATTPSFFSTLKSRSAGMAEKPVVKEAMRKWGVGVNWAAGLRRDGREKDRDRDRERERDKEWDRESSIDTDMEADHGVFWKGARDSSDADGRRRGTYADLRRKVEEREKERLGNMSGGGGRGGSESQPIDIPGTERMGDTSRAPSVRSETSTSSVRKVSPHNVSGTGFLHPSAPRTTTELHTTVPTPSPPPFHVDFLPSDGPRQRPRSTHGTIFPVPPLDESTPPTFATPIRAQPKAATMTIPGIHARHRGEVMALGSEPVKPEDAGETRGATSDNEGRAGTGKTIQSVYRLLRGGNAQASGPIEGVDHGVTGLSESGEGSPSSAVAPNPHRRPSLIPPPLPPRSSTQSSPSSFEREVDSPASQALKSVVQQDAARQPPPLPVRRGSGISFKSADATTVSSSPALLSASPSVSMTPSLSSTSDPEGSWLALTAEQETTTPSSVVVPVADGKGKWRPPLPPRRSTSSINIMQA